MDAGRRLKAGDSAVRGLMLSLTGAVSAAGIQDVHERRFVVGSDGNVVSTAE